jgi:endonuclease/exonuclease/phosphatase family metal-dependent hydrolase
MTPPEPRDSSYLAECRALQAIVRANPALAGLQRRPEWPQIWQRANQVLTSVRRYSPATPPAPPRDDAAVHAVQWNIEHGNWYEQVERALTSHASLAGADVITLDEVDVGCARSGNRDVTGDLAHALGLYGVWAPMFLESTVGRDDDARMAAGRLNEEGLFGIAVLSRWPIGKVTLVDLPGPETIQYDLEGMLGRFTALVCEIERPGAPFVAVALHLEVHRTRAHRAAQVRVLMNALAHEKRPVIIAGDFNTHTFDRGLWDSTLQGAAALMLFPTAMLRARLLHPDRGPWRESLFDEFRRGGFAWEPFMDRAPSLQLRDDRLEESQALPGPLRALADRVLSWAVHRGQLRLDWICGRGWQGGSGHTVSGLDGPGLASDHAPVVAHLWSRT